MLLVVAVELTKLRRVDLLELQHQIICVCNCLYLLLFLVVFPKIGYS